MGFDLVELTFAVEESFQIEIRDKDAQQLLTPGDLVDYVLSRVGESDTSACLKQRAFYRLRRATMLAFFQPRSALKPNTRWDDVIPRRRRRQNWRVLHEATGMKQWPRLTTWAGFSESIETIGETARYLAELSPAVLKQQNERWTRKEVEATITRLMCEVIGITVFRWDQQFVEDLGLD